MPRGVCDRLDNWFASLYSCQSGADERVETGTVTRAIPVESPVAASEPKEEAAKQPEQAVNRATGEFVDPDLADVICRILASELGKAF